MPDQEFAHVNGVDLAYQIEGQGPVVVLLHSGIADSRMWEALFKDLVGHYRVLRYDRRGFGRSPAVSGEFSHTADLLAMLKQLDLSQFALVGSSSGGSLALDFALAYPDWVGALVLAGASPGGFSAVGDDPPQWEALVAAYQAGNFELAAELEVQIWVDGPQRTPAEVDPTVRDLVCRMDVIALRNEASGLLQELPPERKAIEHLDELRMPALIIYGELDDPNMVRAAQLFVERMPHTRRLAFPGAAHFPNLEQPQIFNQAVLAFLGEVLLDPQA
jgi:3-oxoadipate enol-lactonase